MIQKNKFGFSIVSLSIVLAVIAILTIVVTNIYSNVQKKTLTHEATQNAREVGDKAIAFYNIAKRFPQSLQELKNPQYHDAKKDKLIDIPEAHLSDSLKEMVIHEYIDKNLKTKLNYFICQNSNDEIVGAYVSYWNYETFQSTSENTDIKIGDTHGEGIKCQLAPENSPEDLPKDTVDDDDDEYFY